MYDFQDKGTDAIKQKCTMLQNWNWPWILVPGILIPWIPVSWVLVPWVVTSWIISWVIPRVLPRVLPRILPRILSGVIPGVIPWITLWWQISPHGIHTSTKTGPPVLPVIPSSGISTTIIVHSLIVILVIVIHRLIIASTVHRPLRTVWSILWPSVWRTLVVIWSVTALSWCVLVTPLVWMIGWGTTTATSTASFRVQSVPHLSVHHHLLGTAVWVLVIWMCWNLRGIFRLLFPALIKHKIFFDGQTHLRVRNQDGSGTNDILFSVS